MRHASLLTLLLLACDSGKDDTGRDTAPPDDTGDLGRPDGTWDVLVVGAGPAGLAAGLEAQDGGASVRIFEREAHSGGALWWAGSIMLLSGTPSQAAAGVEDSSEILLSEWEGFTGGDPDDPWVRAFAERNVSDVHDWVTAKTRMTIRFSDVDDASCGPTQRTHTASGRGQDLTDNLQAVLGSDLIAFSTTVDGFVLDDDGAVIGLRWHATDDEAVRGWSAASSVVLATGGFLRDLERVRALRPDLEGVDLLYACGPGADGNGHALLEAIGVPWDNGAAVGLYLHGTPDPRVPGEEVVPMFLSSGIWIDADGRRFTDESVTNSLSVADEAIDEAGGLVWVVADAVVVEDGTFMDPLVTGDGSDLYTLDEMLAGGFVHRADTLDGLAAAIGADAAVLQASADGYNAWARREASDAFRGEDEEARMPIETAPFFAVRLVPSTAKAFGGMEVDLDGHAIDAQGDPIPGLFAAGELTGMAGGSLVGDQGFTGSLSAVLLSGRVAGASAAEEALGAR